MKNRRRREAKAKRAVIRKELEAKQVEIQSFKDTASRKRTHGLK